MPHYFSHDLLCFNCLKQGIIRLASFYLLTTSLIKFCGLDTLYRLIDRSIRTVNCLNGRLIWLDFLLICPRNHATWTWQSIQEQKWVKILMSNFNGYENKKGPFLTYISDFIIDIMAPCPTRTKFSMCVDFRHYTLVPNFYFFSPPFH